MAQILRFVVCGAPRSGTSVVAQILNSHPEVCCTHETGLFQPGDMFRRKCQKNLFKRTGFQLKGTWDRMQETLERAAEAKTPKKRVKMVAGALEGPVKALGDKITEYALALQRLEEYCDAAVFVVRDPREVIESRVRRYTDYAPHDERPWYAVATVEECLTTRHAWMNYMKAWEQAEVKMRRFVLNYHKIYEQMGPLAEFLGVSAEKLQKSADWFFMPMPAKWRQSMPDVGSKLPADYESFARKYGVWLE